MKLPNPIQAMFESIPAAVRTKLDLYDILLQKWQAKINLVSNTTLADAQNRHFVDSYQLCQYIPEGTKLLYDIGSGAGFPGLVIAAARPEISVHLIETDQKKCAFLQTVSRETLTPVKVHTDRAERVTLSAPDVVTARALADLTELLRLTERWWQSYEDIVLIFPKGSQAKAEIDAAKKTYQFECTVHPSITDKDASILILTKIKKCE